MVGVSTLCVKGALDKIGKDYFNYGFREVHIDLSNWISRCFHHDDIVNCIIVYVSVTHQQVLVDLSEFLLV